MSESWWLCEGCRQVVEPTAVTFEERHDPKAGGCGGQVVARSITPAPARSEAAGGEEAIACEAACESHAADLGGLLDEKGGRLSTSDRLLIDTCVGDMRDAAQVIASLRQQLAAAREDGERLDHLDRVGLVGDIGSGMSIRFSACREAIDVQRKPAARSEPAREGEGGGV